MPTPAFEYVQNLRDNLTQLLTEYTDLEQGGGGTPTPGNASGIPLPTADLPGWDMIWNDDFDLDMPIGSFPGPYNGKLNAYPSNYNDTSGNGQYNPQTVLSAADSVLNMHVHTSTSNGRPQVAAPVPVIPNGTAVKWPGQKFGRYEVCARFPDLLPGYKVAWLLWPDYGTNTTHKENGTGASVPGGIGEIDYPEVDLNQSSHVGGFVHRLDATVGNDQYAMGNKPCDMTQWHRYAIEWSQDLCRFLLDGVEIGKTTERVPDDLDGCPGSMHWVLQTETTLNGVMPDRNVEGDIEIDWIAIWAKA